MIMVRLAQMRAEILRAAMWVALALGVLGVVNDRDLLARLGVPGLGLRIGNTFA